MPSNPEITIKAIAAAVRSGYLSRERINQSLQRLWQAKTKVISPNSHNPLTELSQPQAIATVTAILTASNRSGGNLFLQSSENDHNCNLIVVDNLLDCEMVAFYTPAVTIPTTKGYEAKIVDRQTLISIPFQPCLLQIFVRGNPFRGSSGLSQQAQTTYQQLLQQNLIKGLVIYGSPYILDWFLPQLPPQLPWVFSYGQMPQAQEIAMKQLFF
jgi:beta-glucosidase